MGPLFLLAVCVPFGPMDGLQKPVHMETVERIARQSESFEQPPPASADVIAKAKQYAVDYGILLAAEGTTQGESGWCGGAPQQLERGQVL